MENLLQDIRYALRQLRKSPGFAVTAILILTIGIGAGTAIFGFVDAALIRPLPYKDPSRLVDVAESATMWPRSNLSYYGFLDWKRLTNTDPEVFHNIVGTKYLEVMGMPVVVGRDLLSQDSAASKPVAVINQTMARTYFGGESPLGRTFSINDEGPEENPHRAEWENIEVVGVAKDAKYVELDEKPTPAAFYPHAQHAGYLDNFVARYTGARQLASRSIAKTISQIDSNLPLGDFSTMAQWVGDSVLNHRVVAQLCTFFGLLAVLLASIGLYGVMSYGVTRRTNEFGVRFALGANRGQVVWLVLRETLTLVVTGLGIGPAVVPAVSRFIVSMLFGLKPYDARRLGLAIFAMTSVALFAGYLPARRAARVDPVIALRYE